MISGASWTAPQLGVFLLLIPLYTCCIPNAYSSSIWDIVSSPGGRVVRELALIESHRWFLPVGSSNPTWAGSQGVKHLTCGCIWGRDIKWGRVGSILQGRQITNNDVD